MVVGLTGRAGGIVDRGADDGGHIDSAVLEEPRVLAVDGGVERELRDLVVRDLLAVLVVDRRNELLAVLAPFARVGRVELVSSGQLAEHDVVRDAVENTDGAGRSDPGDGDGGGDHDRHEKAGQGTEADDTGDRGEHTSTRGFLGRHRIRVRDDPEN